MLIKNSLTGKMFSSSLYDELNTWLLAVYVMLIF